MPYAPHQVAQVHYTAPQSRLLGTKTNLIIAFQIARTVNRKTQKIQGFRTFSTAFLRMPISKSSKFD
jgi:hypothetical protein